MIKHVVLLKFKPSTTPQRIRDIFAGLAGLQQKIPGILDFSGGPYSSEEGLHKGFTHGFIMSFTDAAARDAYLPHPQHEIVKQMIVSELDGGINGAVAFDWES
jgi:hypothetical protein